MSRICKFAMFEHGTSRAEDPQLHVHAVCFNFAMRPDGTTGSVWSNALYDYKMAVGHLIRCELATRLQRDLHWRIVKTLLSLF